MAEANALATDDQAPIDPPADPPQDTDPPEGQETPAEPPESDEPPAPKKGSAEERIRELVAERNATREFAEHILEQYRTLAASAKTPEPPKDEQPRPEPKLEDFEFDAAKWSQAFAQWAREEAQRTARQAAAEAVQQTSKQREQEAARNTWNARLAEFARNKPDAHAVISNPSLPITEHMSEVITASEKGPELAYHLGTHPAEAARIARLSPTQQAAALGRLEAQLSVAPPKRPNVSKAPEPPNPIAGGAAPAIDLENCSINDFLKARLNRR